MFSVAPLLSRESVRSVPSVSSINRAGASPAWVAACSARPHRWRIEGGPARRRVGVDREYRQLFIQLRAGARGTARSLARTHQILEVLAAGAARVFKKRHESIV